VELRVSEDQAAFRFGRQFAGLTGAALMRLLGLLLAVTLLPLADHRAAIAGYVGGSLLGAVVLAQSQLRAALREIGASLATVRHDLVRLGVPVTASSILGVLTVHLDTLVAAGFLEPGDLAQYAVANRLSLIHPTAIGGCTAIAVPVAALLARRGSLDNYARLVTRYGMLLGIGAVALSIALAPFAIQVLFGPQYASSFTIFGVVSLGFLLNYPGNPLSQVLFMTHRAHIIVFVQLGQLAAFATAAAVVAPLWGGFGLATTRAAANLVATGIIAAVSIRVARRSASRARAAHDE
jgi:O-antigen/teichoic acid export membrane protein